MEIIDLIFRILDFVVDLSLIIILLIHVLSIFTEQTKDIKPTNFDIYFLIIICFLLLY